MDETGDDVFEQRLDAVESLCTEASNVFRTQTLLESLPGLEPDASTNPMGIVVVEAFDVDKGASELMCCGEKHFKSVRKSIGETGRSGRRVSKDGQIRSEQTLCRDVVEDEVRRGYIVLILWRIR